MGNSYNNISKSKFDAKLKGYSEEFKNKVYDAYTSMVSQGVDFNKNDYRYSNTFRKYNSQFLPWTSLSIGWFVELVIIPQQRLEEIYGKYALGIERKFTEEELTDETFASYIYNNTGAANDRNTIFHTKGKSQGRNINQLSYEGVYRYFFRKDPNGNKIGLQYRLKDWGIDFDDFYDYDAPQNKYKLLALLYDIEFSHNIRLSYFFSNPSLETTDRSSLGQKTRNGDIVLKLKSGLEKELQLKESSEIFLHVFETIEPWIKYIEQFYSHCFNYNDEKFYNLDELNRINNTLQHFLDNNDIDLEDLSDNYNQSSIKTFYLKILQYERIAEFLDYQKVNDDASSKSEGPASEKIINFVRQHLAFIDKNKIKDYLTETNDQLLSILFDEDIPIFDRRKIFKKATELFDNFIEISETNTFNLWADEVPLLWILVILEEIIAMLNSKDKFPVNFYRHTKSDIKSESNEIKSGTKALVINQLKILKRLRVLSIKYNPVQDIKKAKIVLKIENQIFNILQKIFSAKSITGMMLLSLIYRELFVRMCSSIINYQYTADMLSGQLVENFKFDGVAKFEDSSPTDIMAPYDIYFFLYYLINLIVKM